MENLINRAESGQDLRREKIIRLLSVSDQEAHLLFAAADRVRKEQMGNEISCAALSSFPTIANATAFTAVCAKAIPD